MKKFMRIFLALVVVLCAVMQPAFGDRGRGGFGGRGGHVERFERGGHAEFGVFLGPGWWGPYPYPYYPYYSYYPYYPPSSVIIQQPPEISVQPAPQTEAPSYMYYCKDPQGYYPTIPRCPNGWMKVVPPVNPRQGEE